MDGWSSNKTCVITYNTEALRFTADAPPEDAHPHTFAYYYASVQQQCDFH